MKERYGDKIPLDETVISPGDMFSSELLKPFQKLKRNELLFAKEDEQPGL